MLEALVDCTSKAVLLRDQLSKGVSLNEVLQHLELRGLTNVGREIYDEILAAHNIQSSSQNLNLLWRPAVKQSPQLESGLHTSLRG